MTTPTRAAAKLTGVEAPLLLALALGAALFAAGVGAVLLAVGYEEDAESALYIAAFGVGLPVSVWFALRMSPGAGLDWRRAAWASLGLLPVLAGARLCASLDAPRAGAGVLVGGSLLWLATVAVWAPGRAAVPAPPRWLLVGAAALLAVCLAPAGVLRPGPLAAAALITGALAAAHAVTDGRRLVGVPARAVDAGVVLLAAGLTLDFTPALDPQGFVRAIGHVHHDFYLGPANDVLAGRAVLAGTLSQYGVLPIYLVAGTSLLTPLGYDSLALTAGLLTAIGYGALYAVVRLGGCGRMLAATAVLTAVLAANFAGEPFDGAVLPVFYPGTGGLRFVVVWLVLLLGVCAAAQRGGRAVGLGLALAIVASSLWSLEVFIYAVGVAVVMAAATVAAAPRPAAQLRRLLRNSAAVAGLCVLAHLAVAVGTRLLAGSWPDWGAYLDMVRFYAATNDFSQQVSSWSLGLVLGGLAFGSLAALAVVAARDRDRLVRHRTTAVAIAGCAAFAAVALSYFVGESITYDLQAVAPPAIALVFLWTALFDRAPVRIAAFGGAALLAVGAWGNVTDRLPTTALGLSVPWYGDNGTLVDRLEGLGDMPPLDGRAAAAERLIERRVPGDGPVGMVADSELVVETLFRSGRANALPIAHPLQDELVLDLTMARVDEAIERLRPGSRFVLQSDRLPVNAALRPLDDAVMDRLRARFELVPVESVPEGLTVVRLEPRLVGSGP